MKQVLIKAGAAVVEDVPAPAVSPRNVLVQVLHSCVSVGTEMAGVKNSGTPLYKRALREPENVRRVLEMVRDQGVQRTVAKVSGKMAAGSPTGYSAAGRIVAIGPLVEGFALGDIVACAGAGYANHAEFISVPVNLVARVPDGLSTDIASTVTLGAIALQGVRRACPTLGESVVVVGLGILGQITAQLLLANGCRVIGVDPDPTRIELAQGLGMEHGLDPTAADYATRVRQWTEGLGADAVIVTAAGGSHDIMSQAFAAARKKARVVLVGDVGLHLKRSDIYAKELDFLVSCSYGPGRYDPVYEEEGHDYPLPYVRWTENRNMASYLELIARGRVAIQPLISATYPIAQAPQAFESLKVGENRPLSVILAYDAEPRPRIATVALQPTRPRPRPGVLGVGVIGAGSFVQSVHLPNMARLREAYALRGVMSRNGATATAAARQQGAAYATTDIDEILRDPKIDLVVIGTRHNLHANLVLRALEAGKHVLVEKPLAVSPQGLDDIEAFYRERDKAPVLMTGFNRRFAPGVQAIRQAFSVRSGPMMIDYRMNAGHIPKDHWVHGVEGAGRNIGEACHIYDLFCSLTGALPTDISAHSAGGRSDAWLANDNFSATLRFDDGSVCSLMYTAMGARNYPKERMDIFADGMVASLDDFRSVSFAGTKRPGWAVPAANKGHFEMLQRFATALSDGGWPISLQDQINATRISLEVERLINPGAHWVDETA